MSTLLSIVFTTSAAGALLIGVAGGCGDSDDDTRDLSTPKGAALTFARAIESGNATEARQASLAGGIENDLVTGMAESVPVLKKLDATARAKFGEAGRALVKNSAMDAVALLKEGEVAYLGDGNRAQITTRDGKNSLTLKKVDGQWKVDIGAMIKGQDVTNTVPMIRGVAIAAVEVAAQIDSGKITSVEAAQQALALGTYQAVIKSGAMPAPTTRPSSVLTRKPAVAPPDVAQ